MAWAIGRRKDYAGDGLRRLARRRRDGRQVRRLLALAAIYEGASRTEAARIGVVSQIELTARAVVGVGASRRRSGGRQD